MKNMKNSKTASVKTFVDHKAIGARLRAVREGFGFSRHRVCNLLVLSQTAVRRIEDGAGGCSTETLVGLASIYGCTTDWILGLSDEGGPNFSKTF